MSPITRAERFALGIHHDPVTITATPPSGQRDPPAFVVDSSNTITYDSFSGIGRHVTRESSAGRRADGERWIDAGYPYLILSGQHLAQSNADNTYGWGQPTIDAGTADGVIGVD